MSNPTSIVSTAERMKVENTEGKTSLARVMAQRFDMEPAIFLETVKKTVFPQAGKNTTNEQLAAFLAVAREYDLNPFTREIFAFENHGAIQTIVSVDGWIKLVNRHPKFDGMELEDQLTDDGKLVAVKCTIWRTDRTKPTIITEYMSECIRNTETWKQMPGRMLRHKAVKECARYAFGFAGIQDEDEAMDAVVNATPVLEPIRMPRRLSETAPPSEPTMRSSETAVPAVEPKIVITCDKD